MLEIRRISFSMAILGLFVVGGCASLPENVERPESYAYADTDDTFLGKARRAEIDAHLRQSGFLLLESGIDAFVARAVLANAAERSIDVQYYLFHGDLTGLLFLDQLIKAADRGVRVRLLIDDIALGGKDLGLAVLDDLPNFEVRVFNPFSRNTIRATQFVTRLGSVTRRMHNKSFTVDNQVTIVGGRNIGNEYFEADPNVAFADLDVLAIGPVVKEVSASFDLYWNNELAYPISALISEPVTSEEMEQVRTKYAENVTQHYESDYLQALRDSDLANKIRTDSVRYYWGVAEVMSDDPDKIIHEIDKEELHLSTQLRPHMRAIQKEVILFSPYFVPGTQGVKTLTELSKRGVRVRILTNSLASTDVGVVHAGYAKYRKDLLRDGVELYEMNQKISKEARKEKKGPYGSSKASLHAKSFVLDREHVFIGTVNLDPRSIYENTEIGIFLTSKEMATGMAEWFDDNVERVAFRLELQTDDYGGENIVWYGLEDGEARTFNVDPYTSFWQRFGVGFLSILPIESQL